MIPPLIVRAALDCGLNLIAITDHNASENVAAVIKAAEDTELVVLPGMEVQTQEEVHVLCLFDTLDQIKHLQELIDQTLPPIANNTEFFGEQFIVDSTGEFIQRKEQLLITSTRLSFEDLFTAVSQLEGLFIPAHVNRQAFGLLDHLGFVPPELPIQALEISCHITQEDARKKFPQINNYQLIQSGDVHFLPDFLGVNEFRIESPSILEIKQALAGENRRSFLINASLDEARS